MSGGKGAVRKIKRAQILLAADAESPDEAIALNVGVGTSTVYRTKQNFVECGLDRALTEAPRPGQPRKLSATDEAMLVALACSSPPSGRARWTLDLLAGEVVRLTLHEKLSGDTVGRRLSEIDLKPWLQKMWCIPKIDAEYVARMEDVLDLYAEPPDPARPVVCFDETPRQLIGEARVPIRAEPGKPARADYEYVRNGTANVYMFADVNRPWRHAKVTDRRTCIDFAECMRELVDEHYPAAEKIRLVMDNLSAHSAGALYQAFEPAEARRILNRIEFHFTPNMPAGSTWSRSRSGSWSVSASIAGSPTRRRSPRKSPHGSGAATGPRPRSTGCLRSTEPGRSSAARIRRPADASRLRREPVRTTATRY